MDTNDYCSDFSSVILVMSMEVIKYTELKEINSTCLKVRPLLAASFCFFSLDG